MKAALDQRNRVMAAESARLDLEALIRQSNM